MQEKYRFYRRETSQRQWIGMRQYGAQAKQATRLQKCVEYVAGYWPKDETV